MTLFESDPPKPSPTDTKFVVFRREDWEQRCERLGLSLLPNQIVQDAVVIRRQDMAAPSTFDAYAGFHEGLATTLESILDSVAKLVIAQPQVGDTLKAQIANCRRVADYFHEQAAISWDTIRKIPTP